MAKKITRALPNGYPTPNTIFPQAKSDYGFTVILPNDPKAADIKYSATHTPYQDLNALYGRPSSLKEDAWDYCKSLMGAVYLEVDGSFRNRGVCGGSGFRFTAGCTIESEKYEAVIYIKITKESNYCVVESTNARLQALLKINKLPIFED